MVTLIEFRMPEKFQVLTENKNGVKKLKIRGVFQRADEVNNNGRIYPKKVLTNEIKRLQEAIDSRTCVGALDHPAQDVIHLSQASHLITKLEFNDKNEVIGEAEILSTPAGKIVECLLNDGVKIGISSRGLGTLSEDKKGNKIVNEDFKLVTFDIVADPSTRGAFASLTESKKVSDKVASVIKKTIETKTFIELLQREINKVAENFNKKAKDKPEIKKEVPVAVAPKEVKKEVVETVKPKDELVKIESGSLYDRIQKVVKKLVN